jgi:AcrR family transcriptional regulator
MASQNRRDPRHDDPTHDRQMAEHLRDMVVGKLAEKAAARDRNTPKGRMQAEALDLLTERISSLDMWTRTPPGERRTRITRNELASTALGIVDTEGYDALSMRRLAQELGVGTMSLYHYVRNKDELLSLIHDEVMGEVVLPVGTVLPGTWRDAMRIIANRSRASLLRHGWILELGVDPPIGPNTVRHFDETLQAVSSIDLPLGDRLDIASSIDEFVFGFCLMERQNEHAGTEAEEDMVEYITALMETEQYPALQAIIEEMGFERMWEAVNTTFNRPTRFDEHLEWLFDGIELDIARRRKGA